MVFPNPRSDVWIYFDNIVAEGIAVCKLCKQRIKNDRTWFLRKHLRKLHNAKSELWNYFDNIVGEGLAVCKRCKQKVRNNRSINLTEHLKTIHNIVLINIDDGPKVKKGGTVQKTGRDSNSRIDNIVINISDEESNEETAAQTSYEFPGKSVTPVNSIQIATDNEINFTHDSHSQTSRGSATQNVAPIIIESIKYDDDVECMQEMPAQTNDEYVTQSATPVMNRGGVDVALSETATEDPILNLDNSLLQRKTPIEKVDKRRRTALCIEMDEKTLMSAVWGLMMDDGITPDIFGSKNMQALINPLCKEISKMNNKEFKIDETESEKILCLVENKLRNDFCHDLSWRLLSLKIDTDLSGPENTFCVSTLFVHDGMLHTRLLGVIDLKDDPHLTDQHIKQILHKFNIDSNQVISICWDNTKSKYNTQVKNSDYLKEIEHFEKYPDINFGDIKIEPYVGSFAQLCLLDIFKNSNIYQKFLECRNLVRFICDESNGYYKVFERNNLNIPQLDSPWKWSSTYEMMHHLQEARNILKDVKYPKLEYPEDQFNVNDDLWLFIEAFCKSISYIQKSIIKYYSEEMHFGDFYAQWLKSKLLTAKLATVDNVNNSHITTISSELLKCIKTRSKTILSQDCFEACLYLDPRFQHTLAEEEKTKAFEYLKKIWKRYKIYNVDVINAAMDSKEEAVASPRFADDEDAFLNEFLTRDVKEADIENSDVFAKIESLKLPFKSVDTNILLYWNKLKTSDPEMYALSSICFAIPTTQKFNQNLYTHIYEMMVDSNLSTFTKDNLVSIRLNSHLLEDALELFTHEEKPSSEEQLQELQTFDCNESEAISF